MKTNKVVDAMVMLLTILILVAIVWLFLASIAGAQGQYCYLWQHYRWQWYGSRWVRINYPVWCCGYRCVEACHNYYGGWGPCR